MTRFLFCSSPIPIFRTRQSSNRLFLPSRGVGQKQPSSITPSKVIGTWRLEFDESCDMRVFDSMVGGLFRISRIRMRPFQRGLLH